jgi:hypothetical protein
MLGPALMNGVVSSVLVIWTSRSLRRQASTNLQLWPCFSDMEIAPILLVHKKGRSREVSGIRGPWHYNKRLKPFNFH